MPPYAIADVSETKELKCYEVSMIIWEPFFVSLPVQKYKELLLSYRYIVDLGVGMASHFKVLHQNFFMLWARHCQASNPVWGQVLSPVLLYFIRYCLLFCLLSCIYPSVRVNRAGIVFH